MHSPQSSYLTGIGSSGRGGGGGGGHRGRGGRGRGRDHPVPLVRHSITRSPSPPPLQRPLREVPPAVDDDDLDDLPIHFQVAGTRDDASEVYRRIKTIPSAVQLHPQSNPNGSLRLIDAVMPMAITVAYTPSPSERPERVRWTEVARNIRTRLTLCLVADVAQNVEKLRFLTSRRDVIPAMDVVVCGDETFEMLSELVLLSLSVRKLSLILGPGTHSTLTVSAKALAGLLKALCEVPESSKLQAVVIPEAVRELVTGDPFTWGSTVSECLSNPTAARILKLEPTEIPSPVVTIQPVDSKDCVTLVLPGSGIETFVKGDAVDFPRQRLIASSAFIRNILNENPDETRIPLPLDALKQRSVSVEALVVTAKLLQHCHCREVAAETNFAIGSDADEDSIPPQAEERKRSEEHKKPVWSPEFEEVYEAAFLPLLVESAIASFRRQLALKLFGEILELGRYLELPVAYEFGLVGGVATFAKSIVATPPGTVSEGADSN